jgi:hypothetical protein
VFNRESCYERFAFLRGDRQACRPPLEFVHGSVRHPEELDLIRSHGIQTHSFYALLSSLCSDEALAHKGGAGTDIADMFTYNIEQRDAAG